MYFPPPAICPGRNPRRRFLPAGRIVAIEPLKHDEPPPALLRVRSEMAPPVFGFHGANAATVRGEKVAAPLLAYCTKREVKPPVDTLFLEPLINDVFHT